MARDLLTSRLPTTLVIGGAEYPIYTDFRLWILVTELFADEDVPAGVKVKCASRLIFSGDNPVTGEGGEAYYVEFVREISRFMSGGRSHGKSGAGRNTERAFDFEVDSERIYAAFLQVYGIDLCSPSTRLHFLKFMALLRCLPRETEFMRVVGLRVADLSGIEDDGLRRRVRMARATVRIRKDTEGDLNG